MMLFHIHWSAEDQEWIGTCDAYPSLSHLAPTPCGALMGIMRLQRDVALDLLVEEAQATGDYE
jgi:hypothetical protein